VQRRLTGSIFHGTLLAPEIMAIANSDDAESAMPRWERIVTEPDPRAAGSSSSETFTRIRPQPLQPSDWSRLQDHRRSVSRQGRSDLKPLESLRSGVSVGSSTVAIGSARGKQASDASSKSLFVTLLSRCCGKICSCWQPHTVSAPSKAASEALPPRRWYRVHPEGEGERYFVRPDAGLRGRIPGIAPPTPLNAFKDDPDVQPDVLHVKSKKKCRLRRSQSMPASVERHVGVGADLGFQAGNDALQSVCRICYERPIEVILLPCRHGALCEECLQRALFSRPAHRGGRQCPLCRAKIREVVWIYGDAAIPQYGFSIRAG